MRQALPAMQRVFLLKHVRAMVMIVLLAIGLCGISVLWILPWPQVRLPMPAPVADGGHGWVVAVPESESYLASGQRAIYRLPPGDNFSNYVILLEDGQPLPYPNCSQQSIRHLGAGRYSYWEDRLWFSTPQNDNPALNGHRYELEIRTPPKMRVYLLTFFSFIGLLCLILPEQALKISRLTDEWSEVKTSWARHCDKRFPARLQATFLRPETMHDPGFPAANNFGLALWSRHAPFLAGLALLAFLASYSRVHHSLDDWLDAVDYHAHGSALMERGTSLPRPLSYSMFHESMENGRVPSYANYDVYPSLGYQLVTGGLGKWRGEYSQANGILVAACFTVLFSTVLYLFTFTVTRSRFLAFGVVTACLANPIVMNVAGRPLTDISLPFFLFAALLPMSQGKNLLAGFIFGLGYLFREAGIIYLPVLALASPQSVTWRGYMRALCAAGCGYAFWLAVNQGLIFVFRSGGSSALSGGSFYLNYLHEMMQELMSAFDFQIVTFFRRNMMELARHANPFGILSPLLFVLVMTPVFFSTTVLGRRLVLMGLWGVCIFSAATMLNPFGVDTRYAAPAVCLFWTAIAMAASRFRFGSLVFAVLLVWAIPLSLPGYVNAEALRGLCRPGDAWAHITAPMRAKMRLGSLLKPGSVIVTNYFRMDQMIYSHSHPVLVALPAYETWRTSKGNEHIDVIAVSIVREWQKPVSWPVSDDILVDAYGVRFVRFKGFGDELDAMDPEYFLYRRE